MINETIVFDGEERTVTDCDILKTFFDNPQKIHMNYTEHFSFVTDEKEWFDSLQLGEKYTIQRGARSDQWTLDEKDQKQLKLTFRITHTQSLA